MVVLFFLVLAPNLVFGMCPEPDPVINSYRYKDDNFLEEGSWLNYTCYMNYVLYSGDLDRQCSNGNFTGQPPVCVCPLPSILTESSISKIAMLSDSGLSDYVVHGA
ncbi:hypothetical protein LOTGIDRAFT_172348 [Lottia gigantea]|uniref:Sushi domain-containing protein n=1 Tax=Lottia gigantea TaxID=225164 RepID=V4B867_LOTGI|nr:hypothetical protein LOTGIDRAFT_172348 [Lottia gigantea]ESP01882.1 hypothetical protein LOTGIDRAFT_172348 [Lottia gigantea]